jgi:hypothetical protein
VDTPGAAATNRNVSVGLARLASETSPRSSRAVRAVLVYRHRLLRDIVECLLTEAGVELVATFGEERFDLKVLKLFGPNVVLIDQAAKGTVGLFAEALLFSTELESVSQIVTIGLVEDHMVVCSRHVARRVSAEQLVEAIGLPT